MKPTAIPIKTLWNFVKAKGLGARTNFSPYELASGLLEEAGHSRPLGLPHKKHCETHRHLICSEAPVSISKEQRREARSARRKSEKAQKVAFVVLAERHGYRQAKKRKNLSAAPTSMPYVPMPPPSGVDPRSADFLMTYEWRRVRMMALKRYGAVCQCCGASPEDGAVMNVDHIKPRKFFPQLALDVENLQILCNPCNEGKGNWDMTDWRKEEPERDELHEANMAHLRSIR